MDESEQLAAATGGSGGEPPDEQTLARHAAFVRLAVIETLGALETVVDEIVQEVLVRYLRAPMTGDREDVVRDFLLALTSNVCGEYTGSNSPDPMDEDVITMFRPTGPKELALVAESGWRRWPPRLPGQPIFYPVTNQSYAEQIARDWNVAESGAGFVTRFNVRRQFVDRFEIHQVGGGEHQEWWIPAESLEELNDNIVGEIEVVAKFTA